jgi:hypothetical protein
MLKMPTAKVKTTTIKVEIIEDVKTIAVARAASVVDASNEVESMKAAREVNKPVVVNKWSLKRPKWSLKSLRNVAESVMCKKLK